MDNELIGGEHYGRVGDLPNKLRNESSIKRCVALLNRYQARCLEEVLVFAALFSESCPYDLWRETEKDLPVTSNQENVLIN